MFIPWLEDGKQLSTVIFQAEEENSRLYRNNVTCGATSKIFAVITRNTEKFALQ
jgi:hypothetical protein